MGEVIKTIISEAFLVIVEIFIISKILNREINMKDYRFYLGSIFTIILIIVNYNISTSFIKMFISTIILFLGAKYIFKESLNKTLSSAVLAQIIFFSAEMIFLILVTIINNFSAEELMKSTFGVVITNIIVPLISLCIIYIPSIDKKTKSIANMMETINNKTLTILIVASIIIINLILASIYKQVNFITLMIINTAFISLIIYAVYYTLHSKNKELEERKKALEAENKNIQYQAENDALLNTLNEYERIADQQRVINHENTNQLNALEQMIENNEGEEAILGYIHKLKHDSKTADETIMEKTKRIPSGGLQGIIYQKMIKMKKRKVTYSLNISRDLKELDFKKLGIDTNVDMCKVIGVFLDNAIEEVKGLRERVVDIELYKDEKDFCIGITNSFGKNKNLDHIDELGYTTKGEGHGYGLSLVKQILESNKRLENERRITGRYFTQVLRIKNMK